MEIVEQGREIRMTKWDYDGAVQSQWRHVENSTDRKTAPPWWWGAKAQTHPTALWWKEEGR